MANNTQLIQAKRDFEKTYMEEESIKTPRKMNSKKWLGKKVRKKKRNKEKRPKTTIILPA